MAIRSVQTTQRGRLGQRLLRPGIGAVALALLVGVSACSLERIVGSAAIPPNVLTPAVTKTASGAVAAYRGALVNFRNAFAGGTGTPPNDYVSVSGMFTDELRTYLIGEPLGSDVSAGSYTLLDSRRLPENLANTGNTEDGSTTAIVYSGLQNVRSSASVAVGLLQAYGGDSLKALVGQLDAIEGYSEILLADFYCSGIPLSTLDYSGGVTYKPGSSTEDVYMHAIALFDTAMTLAVDSEQTVNLARVGKARALLALGQYADAAAAVAEVPDGFQWLEIYAPPGASNGSGTVSNFADISTFFYSSWIASVADREGRNGLDYISSNDPRTAVTATGPNSYGETLYHPNKYATDGSSPIVLADWVEARLIEAEAALQAGNTAAWLAKLNYLRENAITPALPDTTDPGTADGRVDLMFRERAFWMFLTGHRQGDLRRLVRQYGRSSDAVYPTGGYPGGYGVYGSDVTAPLSANENSNPLFTGCLNRGA